LARWHKARHKILSGKNLPTNGLFAPVAGSLGVTRYYATATLLTNGEVLILGGSLSDGKAKMAADLSAWIYQP
jgi:hypothetical protein